MDEHSPIWVDNAVFGLKKNVLTGATYLGFHQFQDPKRTNSFLGRVREIAYDKKSGCDAGVF